MVEVREKQVLDLHHALQLLVRVILVHEFADLETDFGILIGIKRCDAGLRGAERRPFQPLFFIHVEKNMIRHDDLHTVGDQNVRLCAFRLDGFEFVKELFDIQCDAVPDDIGDIRVEYPRRHLVERGLPVLIDDGMPGVGTALEPNDDIGLSREDVCDFAFSLVAPVGADDCSDHIFVPPWCLLHRFF